MLKQRILTALALLPPVLLVIFFTSSLTLFMIFGVVGLLIAWEWTALMGLQRTEQRLAYLMLTAVTLALLWLLRTQAQWIFMVSLIWWCLALCLMPGFPTNLEGRKPGAALMGVLGQVLIPPAIFALVNLHGKGVWVLLFALVLVWVADIGAYFAGRAFGRHKLAPLISPGKTFEGAAGGLVLCILWAWGVGPSVFGIAGEALVILVLLSLVVGIFSIAGDLTESAFKRLSGVKDSGSILPGHGGLLDRTDSLLAAMPVFALGLGLIDR